MLERVMIIAGESSGELYGALLALQLKAAYPNVVIRGVGGERMRAAGVELIAPIASSFGLTEVLKTYKKVHQTYHEVISSMESFMPQVLVLIDYPDFNLRIAKKAKALNIKILYYVSPQIWAWRKRRVTQIGALVDMMAVILPFEEEIYKKKNIPSEFVGHPVVDEIASIARHLHKNNEVPLREILDDPALKTHAKAWLGLDPARPLITVMPGSRHHEIKRLLPVLSTSITEMLQRHPDWQFAIPIAPNVEHDIMGCALPGGCRCIKGHSVEALMAADAAIIASGTSTLQAAILKTPMVVVYQLSPLSFFIGKRIVDVTHISLVNLLLERSVHKDSGFRVKELLQSDFTKENIIMEMMQITGDKEYRNTMISELVKVRDLFLDKHASPRVAALVEELAERRNV